jgi:hypothetical protein
MFRTFLQSNQENAIFIQGARNNDSNLPIASVVLQNFDVDSRKIYNMGAVSVVDHFGNEMNGFGDVIIRTTADSSNLTERMRVMYNGDVMIGGTYSNAHLNVARDVYAAGYCNLLTSELLVSDHKAASAALVTTVNDTAEWASNIAQGFYELQTSGGAIGGSLSVNGALEIGRTDIPRAFTMDRGFTCGDFMMRPQSMVRTEDDTTTLSIMVHWNPVITNPGRCYIIADVSQYLANNIEMGYTCKRVSIRTSNNKIEWTQKLAAVGSIEMTSSLWLGEEASASNTLLLTSGTTWTPEDPFTHSMKVDIVYYPPNMTNVYLGGVSSPHDEE